MIRRNKSAENHPYPVAGPRAVDGRAKAAEAQPEEWEMKEDECSGNKGADNQLIRWWASGTVAQGNEINGKLKDEIMRCFF